MKKVISILVIAAMLFMAGCRKNDDTEEETSSDQEQEITTLPNPEVEAAIPEGESEEDAIPETYPPEVLYADTLIREVTIEQGEGEGDFGYTMNIDDITAPFGYAKRIDGFKDLDGEEYPVSVVMRVDAVQKGDQAYQTIQQYKSDAAAPDQSQEYVVVTLDITYEQGDFEFIEWTQNLGTFQRYNLWFSITGEVENLSELLPDSVNRLIIPQGQSAKGRLIFLRDKEDTTTSDLDFLGFAQATTFSLDDEMTGVSP